MNRAVIKRGQHVVAGWIAESEVVEVLTPAAFECGLDRAETAKTIRSGLTAGKARPSAPLQDRDRAEDARAAEISRRFLAGHVGADPETGGLPGEDGGAVASNPFDGVEFDGEVTPEPAWLVKGILHPDGFAFIGGQSGAGKTFVVVDLAVSLASGAPFFGRPVKERVGVAILAAEGGGTLKMRVRIAREAKTGADALPIAIVRRVPDMLNRGEVAKVVAPLREVDSRFRAGHGVRLGAVIIDTVAAAFGLGDENDNAEASKATLMMKTLGEVLGVVVIPVNRKRRSHPTLTAAGE